MASAGTVSVNVVARTEQFMRRMEKVEHRMKRTRQSFMGFTRSIRGLMAIAGGAVAVRGISRMAQEPDEIAKASRRLGMTAANLQRLQHAAQLSGINMQTLHKAVQRMVRGAGEAAKGEGTLVKVLSQLNIEASKFADMPVNQQLALIADEMANATNQAEAMRIAVKFFERGGGEMLQMLQGGSEAFRQMLEDRNRFGGLMTEPEARRIESMNDSITRMNLAWRAMGVEILGRIAPGLESMAKTIQQMVQLVSQFGQRAKREDAIKTMGDWVQQRLRFRTQFGDAGQLFFGPTKWIGRQLGGMYDMAAYQREVAENTRAMRGGNF